MSKYKGAVVRRRKKGVDDPSRKQWIGFFIILAMTVSIVAALIAFA